MKQNYLLWIAVTLLSLAFAWTVREQRRAVAALQSLRAQNSASLADVGDKFEFLGSEMERDAQTQAMDIALKYTDANGEAEMKWMCAQDFAKAYHFSGPPHYTDGTVGTPESVVERIFEAARKVKRSKMDSE